MDAMTLPINRYCSIARALDVVGQRWNLLILREACLGFTKFVEFRRIGIPNATLVQRLDALTRANVLEKRTYRPPGKRGREEYVLTEAGRDAIRVLAALSEWGDTHLPLDTGPGIVFKAAADGRQLHMEFVDENGDAAASETVVATRNAGATARR